MNAGLTFASSVQALFNLANQYANNDMNTEALNTYQVIVKNKMFNNAGNVVMGFDMLPIEQYKLYNC